MDMPWYGWLSSAFVVWLMGFVSGRSAGQAQAMNLILAQQAKAMQMPGLPPGMPGAGGR